MQKQQFHCESDTDYERSQKTHVEQAISSIRWLGFKPDEKVSSQIFIKYLNHLLKSGVPIVASRRIKLVKIPIMVFGGIEAMRILNRNWIKVVLLQYG